VTPNYIYHRTLLIKKLHIEITLKKKKKHDSPLQSKLIAMQLIILILNHTMNEGDPNNG